jgi:hypothetical protein
MANERRHRKGDDETFSATYLYIKKHAITGLLYFGKTTGTEHYLLTEYNGGGNLWRWHLKEHGKEYVETIWYCLFTEQDELVKFATMCSKQWDIVNAKDAAGRKVWANKKTENGLDGNPKGIKFPNRVTSWNKGIPQPEEVSAKTRAKLKGRKGPPSPKKGLVIGSIAKRKQVTCPHCNKIGSDGNMQRYHYNNCKEKNNVRA